jgi:hypothetical protein
MRAGEKLSEYVSFRNDLFFGGAVQISWFETDAKKRDLAATNFVFHGPEYHGVTLEDIGSITDYSLIDTVRFTRDVFKALDSGSSWEPPIALAIAGYGAGKSHFGLTLSTLLADPSNHTADKIVANIEKADGLLGFEISQIVKKWSKPFLVLAINGMNDFDLANELSRQALLQIRKAGLDSAPLDDLWPRFSTAEQFVRRNFDIRKHEFTLRLGETITVDEILNDLKDHDEITYLKINEIFELANGNSIRALGNESPNQLIRTLCDQYCGESNYFKGLVIIFDEFGRYVEFAADKPHIAGDAALQQLFEAVQDNADKCFLLCFIQYQLKVYLARVAGERQTTIQRYISRYDVAKKFYLSCNLETLFANLIEKKKEAKLKKMMDLPEHSRVSSQIHTHINSWLPSSNNFQVWNNKDLFDKVISIGCWPIHPLGIWFLTRLDNLLQSRSSLAFVMEAIDKEQDRLINGQTWPISPTDLCNESLINELMAAEDFGQRGSLAQAFSMVEQKYRNNFNNDERGILKAVLIANKAGFKSIDKTDATLGLSVLAGVSGNRAEKALKSLTSQYGVVEWDDLVKRFEILAFAVPRSEFLRVIRQKSQQISDEQIEDIFASNIKNWAELREIDPEFADQKNISTSEWRFQIDCANFVTLRRVVNASLQVWKMAIRPDEARGKIIYCYVSASQKLDQALQGARVILDEAKRDNACPENAPITILMLHDNQGELQKTLSEYFVLANKLTDSEKDQFKQFIDEYRENLSRDIKNLTERLMNERLYILPSGLKPISMRIKNVAYALFENCYSQVIPFPFDGFKTARGDAAKDCRDMVTELFKGTLDNEWISSRPPKTYNRALELLQRGPNSWGLLGDDGKTLRYPVNLQLRRIISGLDERLKTDGSLNLGKIFNELIEPPYGFNAASASIVMGALVCPRFESLSFEFEGEEITATSLISKIFSSNFLNLEKLNFTNLIKVSEAVSNEWDELLALWDGEQTHHGKVEFAKKAEKLKSRIHLPAGVLFERWNRLNKDAANSYDKLKDYEKFVESQMFHCQAGMAKRSAKRCAKSACELLKKYEELMANEQFWNPEQIQKVIDLTNEAKQAAIQFFEPWLMEQGCVSAQKLYQFNQEMDSVSNNLKILRLPELAEKIEKHRLGIATDISEREKVAYAIERAADLLAAAHVTASTPVASLIELKDTASQNIKALLKAKQLKNITDIDKKIKEMQALESSCKNQISIHKNSMADLFNAVPSDLSEVPKIKSEVERLSSLFSGTDNDLEDLHLMRSQLERFLADKSLFDTTSISNKDLTTRVTELIQSLKSAEDEDDSLPWDYEEVYGHFLETALSRRYALANEWIALNLSTKAQIKRLSAAESETYLSRLRDVPAYLNDEQFKKVMSLRELLKNGLDELEVEGLLVRFRSLPPNLQREFVEVAKRELEAI